MKKIVITGSSGYLGRVLIEYMREIDGDFEILGIDLAPQAEDSDQQADQFLQLDICSEQVGEKLAEFQPDTVIHFAYQVQPTHDTQRMEQTNLVGTERFLDVVSQCRPHQVLLASSTTAFGAWPKSTPFTDTDIPRGRPEFAYSRHKAAMEKLIRKFAMANSEIETSWIRPCVVAGPNMDNYLLRALTTQPFIFRFGRKWPQMQLVHERDVARATIHILQAGEIGPFNVACRETIALNVINQVNPRREIPLPFWLAKSASWLAWKFRLPFHELPPGFLNFSKYPWIGLPDRLENDLEFEFEFSAKETMKFIESQHNKLHHNMSDASLDPKSEP